MNAGAPPAPALPPAILLMGPTASGKTAVAMDLSRRFPVELISVDSAQVFRDMDIGTAKPDAPTLAAFPHHLIDLRDPASFFVTQHFPIRNHDVIYVANSPAAEFEKFLRLVVSVAVPTVTLNAAVR